MTRKRIAEYGMVRSGARALVFRDTVGQHNRTVVEWREGDRKVQETFPDTGEGRRHARQYAQGVVERLQDRATGKERITLTQLFDAYAASKHGWREKTRINEIRRWRYFAETVGPNTFADLVSEGTLDEVARKLRAMRSKKAPNGLAPAQVWAILGNVKRVFDFGHRRKHLGTDPLASYKIERAKDEAPLDVAEFPPEEAAAVIARFTPRDSRRWRAWVAATLAANQGTRITAILKSRDADYDLTARTVRWRAATDKLGRERVQPLTRDAVHAVRVARVWRRRMDYTGQYLIPAVRSTRRDADQSWSYQGLHRLIIEAEKEAGVPHRPYRAMHGFRRMAGGNVLAATGDIKAVGDWLGDRDLRVLQRSYLKERPERLAGIAAKLSTPRTIAEPTARVASERRLNSTDEA